MFCVYTLSTTVEKKKFFNFSHSPKKLYPKKSTKKNYTFQTPSFALCEKLSNLSFVFQLSFQKVLYKSVLRSIIKAPCKSVLFSIITCPHLSFTYHTHKSVLLFSKNLAFRNLTSLIIPKNVFLVCSLKFPLDM